jgi:hypothetical protein
MQFTLSRSYFIVFSLFISSIAIFSFQNCTQTKFSIETPSTVVVTAPTTPICDLSKRLADFEYLQCLAPDQSLRLARQFYNVICKDDGQWIRAIRGSADFSQCPNSCLGTRPSEIENVSCPSPNESNKNGVQRYTVTCLKEGTWIRTITGGVDFSGCGGVCKPEDKLSETSEVACPPPNTNIKSGVQNYTVVCNSDGSWGRSILGSVDYSRCPQSCDPAQKPPISANEKCPASQDLLAVRKYNVVCGSDGKWSKTPTSLDVSLCPAPTCDPFDEAEFTRIIGVSSAVCITKII